MPFHTDLGTNASLVMLNESWSLPRCTTRDVYRAGLSAPQAVSVVLYRSFLVWVALFRKFPLQLFTGVPLYPHLHTGRAVFTGMVAISVWLWQNCMNRPPGFLWTWYLQLHAPPGCTPRHFSFSAQPTVWTKQGVGMGKGFPRLPYTWHIGMVASLSTLVQIPCLWLISRALYYLAIKSQRQETHSWRGVIVCFTSLLTVDRILLSPIMNIYLGGSTLHTPHTHTHKIAPFTATVLRSASKLARVAGRDVCSEPQVFLLSEGLTYRMVNLIFIS